MICARYFFLSDIIFQESPQGHFSVGTAIGVSIQSLEALDDLHSIGYLHRDVKPGNYTIGRAELNELRKVYILDFGMCRKYTNNYGIIRRPREAACFRGNFFFRLHLLQNLSFGIQKKINIINFLL